jgi:hypothetical protein
MIARTPSLPTLLTVLSAALVLPPAVTEAQLIPTVVARYSFDDASARDDSGNGHDGQIGGAPIFETGISGSALRFNGTNDLVRVPQSSAFETEAVDVALWFRLDEAPSDATPLVNKLAGRTGYSLDIDPSGSVVFQISENGPTEQVMSPFPVQPGVWTSVLATYNSGELRLYLHGELVDRKTGVEIGISQLEGGKIFLGQKRQAFFKGVLDEVMIAEGPTSDGFVCANALKLFDRTTRSCIDNYSDMTEELGLADSEHGHFGIAVVDADQDGWLDVYYPNGVGNPDPPGGPVPTGVCPDEHPDPADVDPRNFNTFYLGQGDGTFTADIAAEVGLDDFWNAMRHIWVDYDNDGFRDLFSHNFIVSTLYRRLPGEPMRFRNVNQSSGLEVCLNKGTGASWADLNNDGFLDVYAVEYDPGRLAVDHLSVLYLNNGDGTFREVTAEAGLRNPDNPMGVAFADYDNDGDLDLFVTNSHESPSRLYRHDGVNGNGVPTFTDVAAEAGVALVGDPGRGFGVSFGDYNNDGLLDLLYSRESDSRLFRNEGPDGQGIWRFSDVTGQNGLDFEGLLYQDGEFADLNNDGWLDVLMANGAPAGDEMSANRIFLSDGVGGWSNIAARLGMGYPDDAEQGILPADYDNDGDLDLFFYNHTNPDNGDSSNHVHRNEARGNNWIQFRLTGTTSNRDAVGARILVQAVLAPGQGPRRQMREIAAGVGFFSDAPRIQTIGLGKATTVQASVFWPSGERQSLGVLEVNQRVDVVEP